MQADSSKRTVINDHAIVVIPPIYSGLHGDP
jgi:hypothetical protein